MLSKSKLKKLRADLKHLGFTMEELEAKVQRSSPHLLKIFKGDKYEYTVVKALIDLRDAKKAELEQLQEAI